MSGIIVTIAGPSGSGKTTLERLLMQELGVARLTSITTRQPRADETDGVDYHFITKSKFHDLKTRGELVDASANRGQFYGVTREEVESKFESDLPVVVVVNPHGVHQIREYAEQVGWDHLAVFLDNDPRELIRRFVNRECETSHEHALERMLSGLESLINEELTWVNDFEWDIRVDRFDAETQDEVVNTISSEIAALKLK